MNIFGKFFKKKHPSVTDEEPIPLRIEGIPEAPFTAEPDDAELAAEALLEMMAAMPQKKSRRNKGNKGNPNLADGKDVSAVSVVSAGQNENVADRDVKYYQKLADRIRKAHAKAAQQATRFIYNCELKLENKHLPFYGEGSLGMLEAELYKRIDIVEREGGELKRRWQHCLAEVTVRLMDAPPPERHTESTDSTEKKNP